MRREFDRRGAGIPDPEHRAARINGLNGITLINGSLYDLPLPPCMFDKAILSEVLEHVPDDDGRCARSRGC